MPPVTIVAHDVGTRGGMEGQLGILTQALLDAGVPVTVITRRCEVPPHPLMTVHRIRTPARPFPLGFILFAVAGSWAVVRRRAGIVHATGAIVIPAVDCITVHFCHAAYRDLGLGPRLSAPGPIWRLNAWASEQLAVTAERWCYRRSRTRSVVVVSDGVAGEIGRYFPDLADRVHVIPHGVDSERFRPDRAARADVRARYGVAEDDRLAVFVGGDWQRKGLAHAVEAIARADGWKLLIVGQGHAGPYRQRARSLGVEDRVYFAGLTDAVPEHLAAGDVFVLPTEYETFCLVAFEAAAAGLPVLVSKVSGPDMLIEPGQNGEFLDRDAARTARLLDAYSDPELRRLHGAAARLKASGFSWDNANISHMALYEGLAASGPSPG